MVLIEAIRPLGGKGLAQIRFSEQFPVDEGGGLFYYPVHYYG